MESREQDVQTYETEDGRVPFNTWLEGLRDTKTRAIVRTRINRVRLGNFGDCKSVGSGVLELRIDYGSGYRVYLGQDGERLVILLCGGDKSSQERDIRRAQDYWEDYRRRGNAEKPKL